MSAKSDPRCNKCKGPFASGGVERKRTPIGFGFVAGSTKFTIDYIETKSYIGYCMDCLDESPVVFSRRKGSRTPRSINNKIAAANR